MAKQAKKLTQEDLDKLNNIKDHYSKITEELGLIQLNQINLNNRKLQAEKYLEELKITESELTKLLLDKYGSGNINTSTGEIT
jgi:protein-arginine kinase